MATGAPNAPEGYTDSLEAETGVCASPIVEGQMKKLISVRQALEDPAWLGSMLGAEVLCRHEDALDRRHGRGADGGRNTHFTQLTGRAETPGEAVEEFWLVAGRRSGKTRSIGTLAAYLAACIDYRSVLVPRRARHASDYGGEHLAGGPGVQLSQGHFH